MRLSELCIRRPVMTTLVMASLLLAGFFGYRQLPIAAIPRIEVPTITVTVQYPGASPDTMAVSVAAPLERQFATIAGITSITSLSTQGLTQIALEFDLNRSIDAAALRGADRQHSHAAAALHSGNQGCRALRGLFQAGGGGLAQRRAGAAAGCRQGRRLRGGRGSQNGVRRRSLHHRLHSAPARRQH